ncbi:MAG: alpha-amylase [Lachnospiraceae bacterium]|nr:alpha-amylase [Lachnospiraceae bacterium]
MGTWYDNAVFYHIYPLGLIGAPKLNCEYDAQLGTHGFEELKGWVEHIKESGFTAIYIGPLFESVGHGYETTDYRKVDRRIGTNGEFAEYVRYCHANGIRVIVDGVFNHTGREFFAFRDIKENRENSRYKDWYCNVNFYGNNEYNDGFSYENWGGYNLLAKLNLQNPEVKQYLLDVVAFWIREFDIDGIRLDAADVMDFMFMKELRSFCNGQKEDFWLMGEVIHGDYSRWVNDEMLHCCTNYELHKALFSGHNDHNYFEIAHNVKRLLDICRGRKLYTFVDNHDVARIYNKVNNKEHLPLVYMLAYTLPGIPSVYYGSEFMVEGEKQAGSDDSLRPRLELPKLSPICEEVTPEQMARGEGSLRGRVYQLIKKLGQLKKERIELNEGRYQEMLLTNRQFVFGRFVERQATITVLNNDDVPATVRVSLEHTECHGCNQATDLLTQDAYEIKDGCLEMEIPANSGKLIGILR